MLSKISNSIRSFLVGDDQPEVAKKRKRNFDGDEELDDYGLRRPKRARRDQPQTQDSTGGILPVTVGRFASWIGQKKQSFKDNYYYKRLVEYMNPQRKIERERKADQRRIQQQQLQEGYLRQANAGNIVGHGAGVIMGSCLPQTHPPAYSTPVKMGTDNSSGHSGPNNGTFKMPRPVMSHQTANHPPSNHHESGAKPKTSYTNHSNNGSSDYHYSSRGKPRDGTYRSMYDKTFQLAERKNRNKLTARESIRLEEKNLYEMALHHFTRPPGLDYGSGLYSKHTPIIPRTSSRASSLSNQRQSQGRDSPLFDSLRSPSPPGSIPVRPSKTGGLSQKTDLSDRSYIELQSNRISGRESIRSSRPQSPQLSQASRPASDVGSDEIVILDEDFSDRRDSFSERSVSPTNSFQKSYQESSCAASNFVQDLTDKYSVTARRRDRKIREQEITVEHQLGKREEWEASLEDRLRQRLRLAERQPVVEEQIYESSSEEEEEEEEEGFIELTEDQEEMVDQALHPNPPGQVLCEGFRLQICRKDMITLSGLNWLNDEVINFYMNLLMERGSQDNFPSVWAFNTFFLPKLLSSGHQGVKRWTRKKDVLAMDFILIPVHLGMHWCLAVIDFKEKQIQYYDSMGKENNRCLKALLQYLCDESQEKKQKTFDTAGWSLVNVQGIPQQMNGSDCGMFACKFAECVVRRSPINFTQEHMPYFRRRMVYEILTKQLL